MDDSDYETNCDSSERLRKSLANGNGATQIVCLKGSGTSGKHSAKRVSRQTWITVPIFVLLFAGVVFCIIFCAKLLDENAELKKEVSDLKLAVETYRRENKQNSIVTDLKASVEKYREETLSRFKEIDSSLSAVSESNEGIKNDVKIRDSAVRAAKEDIVKVNSSFHHFEDGVDLISSKLKSMEVGLRLVNGTHAGEGLVEIWHDGLWGKLCHGHHWWIESATVTCRALGYEGASRYIQHSAKNRSDDTIWLQAINCGGKERHITECAYDGWGFVLPYCYDQQLYAGVECY